MCEEWFHNECVGLPKNVSASQMQQYVCVVCSRMRDVTCEKLEVFLRCRRIKEPELELLLREEKDLPIAATREFKALNEFRGLITAWRESCEEELKRGVDLDQLEELTGRKGERDFREERMRGLYLGKPFLRTRRERELPCGVCGRRAADAVAQAARLGEESAACDR